MANDWVARCKAHSAANGCSYKQSMMALAAPKTAKQLAAVNKRKAKKAMQSGKGIFEDLGKAAKILITDPKRISRSITKLNNSKDPRLKDWLNPLNKDHGVKRAVKAWTDENDPKYKEVHAYAKPVMDLLAQGVNAADKSGASGNIFGKVVDANAEDWERYGDNAKQMAMDDAKKRWASAAAKYGKKAPASSSTALVGAGKSRKATTPNRWILHVKSYAAKHNVPYRDAMSLAKASYKK